jgi:CBS domain-containing protein
VRAKDVMTSPVITVGLDAPIKEIADRLLEHRISAVPVLDPAGKLSGIVSEGDLVRRSEIGTERQPSWWLMLVGSSADRANEYIRRHGGTARDIMSTQVITVEEDSSVAEIAALLEKHRIKRVPVVRGQQVVGIVSRANLVQALSAMKGRSFEPPKSDQDLRARVLSSIARTRHLTSLINVMVDQGHVLIWGAVGTEREREAIRIAAEQVAPAKQIENNVQVVLGMTDRSTWAD